jgi:hypothetical protein
MVDYRLSLERKMDSWKKLSIYDYWDSRTGAIEVFSEALRYTRELEPEKEPQIISSIKEGVQSGVRNLSDSEVMKMSVSMIDDLYKVASSTETWDDSVYDYISASAGTFSTAVANRGYVIHYLVDNCFEKSDVGMQRPLDLFPGWFEAAGFIYISPQLCALMLMDADNVNRSDFVSALPRYIDEARHVSSEIVERCHQEIRHYVYLDTDSVPESFDKAMGSNKSPGVITVLRDGAPDSESKIEVAFPREALT